MNMSFHSKMKHGLQRTLSSAWRLADRGMEELCMSGALDGPVESV